MKLRLLLLLAAFLHAGYGFMPSRVGQLVPSGASNSVSGLVFLLNHTTIYIRDFQFDVVGRGVFCAGSSIDDTSDAYTIPFTLNSERLTFPTGYSSSDIELQLPGGKTVASVGWIGVCRVNVTRILASVIVHPETVTNVPCETTFIGELPAGSNGLAGRVYLLNRVTFAVVGFSYDGQADDAFFWVGSGESPSISGYACTYNQDINSRLPAVRDQDVVVHLPSEAEGKQIDHLAVWCRSNNRNLGHITVQEDLIPTKEKPPMPTITTPTNSPVFLGSLTSNAHGVHGNVFALDERTLMLTEFSYDGVAPAARFYAVRGPSVNSPEFWILNDENGSGEKLSEYVNATIVITLPDEITVHTIDWFSVWCVEFNVSFGELQIPDEIQFQAEVPDSAVFLGSLTSNAHGVHGNVFALDERTLMLTEFSYDGAAPAARFYAVRGPSVNSPEFWILKDENGSGEKLSEYVNATIVITLPNEITVHTIDWFSVWCVEFNVSFGELQIPDEIQFQAEVPASAVFLGSLTSNAHGVHGNVFALDERTLMLTEFSYDGAAPAARFYAVRGPSVNSPEFWILKDENGSGEKLSEYVNATIVITLPDEITVHTIDWFSVWCVEFNVSFGELQIPDEIQFQAEVPDSAVFLGSLTSNAHGVHGNVFALDERTLMLTEFSYDGAAPAARFYAVRGPSVNSPEFWILKDENGSGEKLSEYVNATIVITLPNEITVHTIDWFSVWCVEFNVSFGELQIPDEIQFQAEVPDSAVFLGSLTSNAHGVHGNVFALDERTLMLTEFSYDGAAPAARFYAVRGPSVNSPEFWILKDENGSGEKLSEYVNATIVITLPDEITVHTIDWFSVWCVEFNVSFGELQIPDEIPLQAEVPASAVFLGSLTSNAHGVHGFIFALDERTLMLTEFSYDGAAPAARFYAVRGPSVNSPEFWILKDENGSGEKLSEYVNATIVITLPDEITIHTIDWFSVWCVEFNVSFGELQIPDEIPLQAEVPASAVFLGSLTSNAHGVHGFVFALDERTLMLTEFFYDGAAPAARFYAVRGPSVNSPEFWILKDENGSGEKLSEYLNATIVIMLPNEITIHTIDWFSVWCVEFNISFGELQIPDDLPTFAPAAPTPTTPAPTPSAPTLPPVEECTSLESQQPVNCKQLTDDIKMSWVIDRITDTIYITLCGCVQPDNYIAFGLSGSVGRVQMVRGDVTWTWLDSEGVHAQDLDLSAYAQCFMTRRQDGRILQTGVCPDVQNNVFSVSGSREGCTTCINYARPLQSADGTDIPFLLDREQYVIWSMGPVGSLVTPLGTTIPVPFRHFARANPTDDLRVNFSRTPVDECNLQCADCSVAVQPWPRPVLEHTTTINARIGQSGSEKGYAGITGTAGWGIAWYLNGLLIPDVTVYRGTTYTFMIEGGENSANSARYHPFYITDNSRGGYLAKLQAGRQLQETVYAGFAFDEDNKPLGVGRYCEYKNIRGDRSSEFDTFDDYKSSLKLECDEGEAGSFTWTPDENTPDVVYYQCATHQFLGWSMQVRDAATTSSPPVVIDPEDPSVDPPIPGEDDTLNPGGLNGGVQMSAALRLIIGALSFTILVVFSL